MFNSEIIDIFNKIDTLNKLESDLYGWLSYSGHVNWIEIYVTRFPQVNGERLFEKTISLDDIKKYRLEIAKVVDKLSQIIADEEVRISELDLLKQLKEKYEGDK
jgi:hypothetical protein